MPTAARHRVAEEVLEATERRPQLHLFFDGRSHDLNLAELDVGVVSSDDQIKAAAANGVGAPASKLATWAVERNEQTGDITVRPPAVFA